MSSRLLDAFISATKPVLATNVLPRPVHLTRQKILKDERNAEYIQLQNILIKRYLIRYNRALSVAWDKELAERAYLAEKKKHKTIRSEKKQRYWNQLKAIYQNNRAFTVNQKLNLWYAQETWKKKARLEFLHALNEDVHLWTKSPEDLRFRGYIIGNPHFYSRLPTSSTYALPTPLKFPEIDEETFRYVPENQTKEYNEKLKELGFQKGPKKQRKEPNFWDNDYEKEVLKDQLDAIHQKYHNTRNRPLPTNEEIDEIIEKENRMPKRDRKFSNEDSDLESDEDDRYEFKSDEEDSMTENEKDEESELSESEESEVDEGFTDVERDELNMSEEEEGFTDPENELSQNEDELSVSEDELSVNEKENEPSEKELSENEENEENENKLSLSENELSVSENELSVSEDELSVSENELSVSEDELSVNENENEPSENEPGENGLNGQNEDKLSVTQNEGEQQFSESEQSENEQSENEQSENEQSENEQSESEGEGEQHQLRSDLEGFEIPEGPDLTFSKYDYAHTDDDFDATVYHGTYEREIDYEKRFKERNKEFEEVLLSYATTRERYENLSSEDNDNDNDERDMDYEKSFEETQKILEEGLRPYDPMKELDESLRPTDNDNDNDTVLLYRPDKEQKFEDYLEYVESFSKEDFDREQDEEDRANEQLIDPKADMETQHMDLLFENPTFSQYHPAPKEFWEKSKEVDSNVKASVQSPEERDIKGRTGEFYDYHSEKFKRKTVERGFLEAVRNQSLAFGRVHPLAKEDVDSTELQKEDAEVVGVDWHVMKQVIDNPSEEQPPPKKRGRGRPRKNKDQSVPKEEK